MDMHYRLDGECTPCGDSIHPGWLALAIIVSFVSVALLADRFLARVKDVAELMAPGMILMTFFQTLALLLQINLVWPPYLKQLMIWLSYFNFNIELARPECSLDWNASSKMDVILMSPLAILTLILTYGTAKFMIHTDVPADSSGDFGAHRFHEIRMSCEKMAVGALMVLSSFYLKGVLGGFDCTASANSKQYLDIQPAVECDTTVTNVTVGYGAMQETLPDYLIVYQKAIFGCCIWVVVMISFVKYFATDDGRIRYLFLSAKMEDRWYWWELVLLTRKLLIMTCGLFNTEHPERGWYLGSMVII
jgi:hypothetical protein